MQIRRIQVLAMVAVLMGACSVSGGKKEGGGGPPPTQSPAPSPGPTPTKSPDPIPEPSPTKSPDPSPEPSPTKTPVPEPEAFHKAFFDRVIKQSDERKLAETSDVVALWLGNIVSEIKGTNPRPSDADAKKMARAILDGDGKIREGLSFDAYLASYRAL